MLTSPLCSMCNQPREEGRRDPYCRVCRAIYMRHYRRRNKERLKARRHVLRQEAKRWAVGKAPEPVEALGPVPKPLFREMLAKRLADPEFRAMYERVTGNFAAMAKK